MVNPIALYLISILYNIDMISNVFFWVALFLGLISGSHIWIYVVFICLFFKILIPTKSDMYAILTAHYLTAENIEVMKSLGIDSVQQFIDMILDPDRDSKF